MFAFADGDHSAEVTVPTTLRPSAVVDVRGTRRLVALDVELARSGSASRVFCSSSSARRPLKTGLLKSTSRPRSSSNGERERSGMIAWSAGRKSTCAWMKPASMRATSSACVPIGRMPWFAPLSNSASHSVERARRVDPQLVAEIAGEAGARHHQFAAGEREVADVEGLQILDARAADRLQHGAAGRALQRQRGDVVRVLDDLDVETEGRARQPVELALLRAQPVVALAQVKDRAVVDDLAVVVAPDAVADPAGLDLGDVAGDQPVQERQAHPGPVIRCLVIGVRSNTAQALRIAAYSSATSK